MARVVVGDYTPNKIKTRPGIHAKSKSSKMKQSKNYVKQYKGQGK
jgi:hypothetical protein